jgi:hypothetical protein
MKFYIDLASRRFVKAPTSPVPLQRVFFKRRDIIDVEVVFVDRSAIVPTPLGTTLQTALKRSFSDPQFLASAANDGTLNLYTVSVEELFPGNTASAAALLEVKYTRPGEETRTATLVVELQNSVILGTEGTPVAVPDLKATLADAETGTDNTRWMTPLRVWDAIRKAATAAVTWANLPGKPSTFPPEAHTHTAAQITDFAAAVTAVAPPPGALIISKTYAELKAIKDANQLVPGQWYKITDFQLKWWNQSINHTVVLTSPVVEPLNVFSIAVNKFSPIAYSDLYPTDSIYYDFDAVTSYNWGQINNTAPITGIKGLIFRRIDNKWNIDMPYDFRHITVNCCRPDLSTVSEWSSSINYKELDVVKSNNKLFFAISDNLNVSVNNVFNWQPVSDYNEGLTYFPTDESFGFVVYKPIQNFNNNWQFLVNLPPLLLSRVQKPTFTTTSEGVGVFVETSANVKVGAGSHSNLFTQPVRLIYLGGNSYFNIFKDTIGLNTGDTFERNILGSYIRDNVFGQNCGKNIIHSMFENNIADTFWHNTLGSAASDNTFEGKVAGNIFGLGLVKNKLSTGFNSNFIKQQFIYNNIGNGFTGNRIGASVNNVTTLGGFKDNIIKSMDSCIIGGNFNFNNIEIFSRVNIGAFCSNNTITGDFGASIIGNNFQNNLIKQNCFWNNIGDSFTSNNIGTFFIGNIIGHYFSNNTIGNYFRKNTITANALQDATFSTASHVYNDYDCTIFKNSSGQPRLSYYNAADQLVVTSPTA